MSQVTLYSNYVNKNNATMLDTDSQAEEVIFIVRQALENGVKEICFNYAEEGPEDSNPVECGKCGISG